MSYIKKFINSKKKNQNKSLKTQNLNPESLFKEPIESIFDKPEIIKANFEDYLKYSENYYNNLIKNNITIDFEYITKFTENIINIDKNNEIEYYRYLFLLEYLSLFSK